MWSSTHAYTCALTLVFWTPTSSFLAAVGNDSIGLATNNQFNMPQAIKKSSESEQRLNVPKTDIKDTISKQIDILFQDSDFIRKISKILVDCLIEPVKKAITDSIMESVKESLKYELKNTIGKLAKLQKKYDDLEDTLDKQEQYSRRNCLVVSGVPENDRENTNKVIRDIFKNNLNIEVQPSESSDYAHLKVCYSHFTLKIHVNCH